MCICLHFVYKGAFEDDLGTGSKRMRIARDMYHKITSVYERSSRHWILISPNDTCVPYQYTHLSKTLSSPEKR